MLDEAAERKLTVHVRSTPTLSPYSEPKIDAVPLAPRLDTLEGKRVALWSNRLRTARPTLKAVERFLEEEAKVAEYFYVWGYGPHGIEPQQVDLDAAAEADAVIAAAAECGSCTTWIAVASSEIEKRGTPTVTFATEPFAIEFARISKGVGIPYPSFVVISPKVEHPTVIAEEVAKRLEEMRYLLTTDSEIIQKEYMDKWVDHEYEPVLA